MNKNIRSRIQVIALTVFAVMSPLAHATTTLNHQFTPATISQGDVSTYRVTFANDDTGAGLTDMLFTILLQPEITIAAPLNIVNTCGFTVNQPIAPGASTIELVDGSLAAAQPGDAALCYFEIDVTSVEPGNWINTVPASTTPDDTTTGYSAVSNGVVLTNTTPANATLAVNTLHPPEGLKIFNPSPAVVGDPVTLTITLSNPNGTSTIPLTSFTDALPDNGSGHAMLVDGTPTVSCTGAGSVDGSVSVAGNQKSVTLTGGVIGEGGVCTITVPVVVDIIDGESETFTNSLNAGAIGNTRGLTSPEFSAELEVDSPILIAKSFGTSPVPAGQPSLMTLTVTNRSTGEPLDITSFSDDLTGTSIVILSTTSSPIAADSDPQVTCTGAGSDNGDLDWTADVEDTAITLSDATAGPGGICTITAWVTSSADGSHINTTGTVDNPDNFASTPATDTLTTLSGLTVEKAVTVGSVAPGQWTEFAVTIKNYSPGQVTDVSFQDLLPAAGGYQMVVFDPGTGIYDTSAGCIGGDFSGLTAAGADTASEPLSEVDAGLLWTDGTIEAGADGEPGECTITFRAMVPEGAPADLVFTNEIPAGSVTGQDPSSGVDNEDASNPVDVVSLDPILVAKSFTPSSIPQGGVATLTIAIYNRMVNPLTSISLTDTLPAGLELAANPAPVNNCGGILQAFPGDDQIILSNGTMGPRPDDAVNNSCTISVQVTGITVGTYANTIGVDDFSAAEEDISKPATSTLMITPGIIGSKSFAPAVVSSGGTARLTINVSNASNTQLTNLSIDDADFGAGLTIANPANAATSCAGSPTMIANPGAGSAQMLGAILNAGASCTFSFDVSTSGSGPWTNTISAGNITSAEGPVSTEEISASLEENATVEGSIGINKAFLTPIVTGAKPSVLQIDVINNASFEITGATFTDTFPEGIVNYSVPDASTNCAGGVVTAIPGDGKVMLSGATLAPNATCSVFVTTTALKFLNLTNTIPAGAVTTNEGYTNPLGTTATLATLQGLGVMKGFSPSFIGIDQTARLKIELINSFDPFLVSSLSLTNVSFTDTLPAGMTVASPLYLATTCSDGGGGLAPLTAVVGGSSVSLSGATIVAGETCVIEVDVSATEEGTYDNSIPAGGVTSDEAISNTNDASASLNVVAQPTIAKAFSKSPVIIGEISRLTISIDNNTDADLSGVTLSDVLPAGLALAAAPNAATTCPNGVVSANGGASVVSIAGATIASGSSCTFSADVLANAAGDYANSIAAGALVSDQGLTNPAQVDATLDVIPPASVTKSFSPARIDSGGTSTLTITLLNSSDAAITLTAPLVDALPGLVVVEDPPNIGGTCPSALLSAVSATAGGTTVTMADGSVIPSGNCTVTVDVTSDDSGSYVNVIAAGQMHTSAGNNQEAAIATLGVDQNAAPTIGKVFDATTILTGGSSTLTITIGNPNTTPLTLAEDFTDTLPAGVIISSLILPSDCGSLVSFPDSIGLASGSTIPAGGCTINATVTSSVPGAYTNTIAAEELVTTEAGSPPYPAEAGLVVKTLIPPHIQKSFSPSTINPGGISTLTITLNNDNPSDLTLSSALTDTLPANLLLVMAPTFGGSCPGTMTGAVTAAGDGTSITYASGSIIPPGPCTITVDVTSALPGGPYTNTIPAGALQTNAGNNGAPAIADLLVNPLQPPSVGKSFSPTPLPKNATSALTISLRNGNTVPITLSIDFIDTLPTDVVIATPSGLLTGPGCDASKVVANAGETTVTYQSGAVIAADSGCAIQVNVTSASAGTYTNSIAAGDLQTSAGGNVLAADADIQFVEWPSDSDILLEKTVTPGTGFAGSSQTVTLSWRNKDSDVPLQNLYQCMVSDPLPASVFDWATVSEGTTPAGYTFSYDLGSGTVSYTRDDTTTPCETSLQTATFSVNLKADVITGSTYTNTATASGLTLPSDEPNAALAETRSTTAEDDVVVTAPSALAKTVESTSQDFTDPADANVNSNPVVAIGETVAYSLPFTLPPGNSNEIVLADHIVSGIDDVELVTVTLTRSSANLTALDNPGLINAATAGDPVDVKDDMMTVGDEFLLVLGNVVNTDVANQTYTLVITLLVKEESLTNTLSHPIVDRGRMYYREADFDPDLDPLSVASLPKSVHIGLPGIALEKEANPGSPSAGGTVTYTLTIKNPAGTDTVTGFDITYSDILPADLIDPTAPTFDAGTTGAVITGSFSGNTLSGTVDRLDPGESVTVSYTAQVKADTPFGTSIVNSASATITTLEGSSDEEREIESSAATAPLVTATPSITKSIIDPQNRYPIGEIVNYRLTVSLPVGTTDNLTVSDTLPAGLAYIDGSAMLTVPADISGDTVGTGPAGPTAITPTAPGLTFSLGSEIDVDTAGNLTIDFQAQVRNIDSNQDNTSLLNTAGATYDNPQGGDPLQISAANPPEIVVGEPNFSMNKEVISGAAGSDSGDTVRWQFTVENTGTTIAYQAVIDDTLPVGLTGISNIVVTPSGGDIRHNIAGCDSGPVVSMSDAMLSETNTANDTLSFVDLCFAPGSTLTVAFDTTVTDVVTPGQTLTNVVEGTYASQATGSSDSDVVRDGALADSDDDSHNPEDGIDPENNYNELASNTLMIDAPIAIDKQADKESATIGETLVYTLKVSLIEGSTPEVIVTDILPAGLSYVSHAIDMGNVGITPGNPTYLERLGSGQTVQFYFGDVQNNTNESDSDDYIEIDVTVRVDNILDNQNGSVLKNGEDGTVTVEYGLISTTVAYDFDGTESGIQGRPLTIIEPILEVSKTAVPTSQALGDIVTFTVTIEHTAESTSDALNVVLTDTLPAGLEFIAGSVIPANAFVGIDGQVLSLQVDPSDPLTLLKHQVTIEYQALITTAAAVDSLLTNQVAGSYGSTLDANGDADSGRNGEDGEGDDALNNYVLEASAAVTPHADAAIYPTKTVSQVSDDNVDNVLNPGEQVEYTVILHNTSTDTLTHVVFTDTLPSQVTYLAGSLSSTLGSVDDSSAPTLEVDIDSLDPDAMATITFRAEVNAGVAAGMVISNQGSVDTDQTVPTPTDRDGVPGNGAQPTDITVGGVPTPASGLDAEKLVAWLEDNDGSGTVTQGDTMRYTIVLANVGSVPLTGVGFSDTIPDGLTYVATSAVASNGTVAVNLQDVSWTGLSPLAVGAFATLTLDVTINSVDEPSETFINQGTASSNETGDVSTDSNGNPSDGDQPTVFTALNGGTGMPVLELHKTSAVVIDTAPEGVASPQDTLQYTITLINTGSMAASDVRFTDPVPVCTGDLNPCTSYVPGSLITSLGAIVSETPIEVNLGTVPVGGLATITFRVQVDAATGNGAVVVNQGFVTHAGDPTPVPSDDNGNPTDGLNPTLTPITVILGSSGVPRAMNKILLETSEPDEFSSQTAVLIGELARFQVSVDLPTGTVAQVTMLDTLPEGMAYLPDSATLTRVFETSLSASANPGDINGAASGSPVPVQDGSELSISVEADGTTLLELFLGDIINSDLDDNSEMYLLEYSVVVQNVDGNQDGTTLSNSATVSYWNTLSQPRIVPPASTTLTVSEPSIMVSKSAKPTSIVPSGGDTTYSITITNAADAAPAFDVVLNDPLPVEFTSIGDREITSTGATGVIDASSGTTLDVTIDRLDAGGSVTITFTATAEVTPPEELEDGPLLNTVFATWTSLPGSNGTGEATPGTPGTDDGERTGSGEPEVNDYSGEASVEVHVGLPLTFQVSKRFADGNPMKVEVVLSCDGGYPNTQSSMINQYGYKEFVVQNHTPGLINCHVTEVVPNGYTPAYEAFETDSVIAESIGADDMGCHFEGISAGGFICEITNTPQAVEVSVSKQWLVMGSETLEVPQVTDIRISCDSEILEPEEDPGHEYWIGSTDDGYAYVAYAVAGDVDIMVDVVPDYPETQCWASENIQSSGIEKVSDCGDAIEPGMHISAGDGDSCQMVNSLFYEGIPTLNQFGLMLLSLLMLAVGVIGVRRYT